MHTHREIVEDRGAWRTTVRVVAKGWTQLSHRATTILIHFAVYLKLTHQCKSTILQLKKKKRKKLPEQKQIAVSLDSSWRWLPIFIPTKYIFNCDIHSVESWAVETLGRFGPWEAEQWGRHRAGCCHSATYWVCFRWPGWVADLSSWHVKTVPPCIANIPLLLLCFLRDFLRPVTNLP